jgi:hypothetical protein
MLQMKKKVLAIGLTVCSLNAMAQRGSLFYLEAGGGGGSHVCFKLGLNLVIHQSDVVSFYYFYNYKVSSNTPSDYHPGLFEGRPHSVMSVFSLMYGQMIPTNSPDVRYNLKGGVVMGSTIYPVNFKRVHDTGFFNFSSRL